VVQSVVKGTVGVIRPERRPKLLAGHDLTGLLEKSQENLKRLGLQAEALFAHAKLTRCGVEHAVAETVDVMFRGEQKVPPNNVCRMGTALPSTT
jgi:hypothetical protein